MHYTMVSGTKEYLLVTVGDRLEDITNLNLLAPIFSVYDKLDNPKQSAVPADVDADNTLIAKCLVDTTTGGNWSSGIYRLYLTLSAAPEEPVLGPLEFKVEVI